MAGTFVWVKIKVKTDTRQYQREDETNWISTKEKIQAAYEVIADNLIDIIDMLTKRDPHRGLSPRDPSPQLESFSWAVMSRYNKFIRGGTYSELKEGDPPVAFMTPLPTRIDRALEKYHQERNKQGDPNR